MLDVMLILLPTTEDAPNSMIPPGCNELSATWHRRLNTKSKAMLGIPSAELLLRN
jgi:hypothetical protein